MKKVMFIIFSIGIIICSIIGYISNSYNKKSFGDPINEKSKYDNKLVCYDNNEEENIEATFKFDSDGIVKNNISVIVYSTVSNTDSEYKNQVEEYFKEMFCDENSSNCKFEWNDNKITLTFKYKVPEYLVGLDKKSVKNKIMGKNPTYECK